MSQLPHRTTLPKLKNVVIQAVLAQPQAQLLEKETGVVYLLDNDKREDLARMHRMFTLVDNGLAPIAQSFRQYVTDRGNQIVDERVEQQKSISSKAEALNDPTFIQTLLELHDRFKGIVHECFSQDSLFQKSLKEAFEVFVNRDIGKFSFAALMSSFCDRILKKSGERLSDEQVETLLTKMASAGLAVASADAELWCLAAVIGHVHDAPGPLPPQQIIQVDQDIEVTRALSITKQAVPLRPPLVLKDRPSLRSGKLTLPLRGCGLVLLLQGAEMEEDASEDSEAWPRPRYTRLLRQEAQESLELDLDPPIQWPLVVVLLPSGSLEEPPDGSVMIFCEWVEDRLAVARQLVAWRGKAFELQALFGIQELFGEERNQTCVICLTELKNTALLPCRHFCCCHDCALPLRISGRRCPLCRREVSGLLRLDMAGPEEGPPAEPPSEPAEPQAESAEVHLAQPAHSAMPSASEGAGDGLPARALQRLSRELKQLQLRRGELMAEHRLELNLRDDGDLRCWLLRLQAEGFTGSELGRQLERWDVDAVELEIWIPPRFPVGPPAVRVLRPSFAPGSFYIHAYGALCAEVLSSQGWSPGLTLPQLGLQIKTLLLQGTGRLVGSGPMTLADAASRERAMHVASRIEREHRVRALAHAICGLSGFVAFRVGSGVWVDPVDAYNLPLDGCGAAALCLAMAMQPRGIYARQVLAMGSEVTEDAYAEGGTALAEAWLEVANLAYERLMPVRGSSGLCFNKAGQPWCLATMREAFGQRLESTLELTTYSWRRLSPTVAQLMGLQDQAMLPLGDWQDKGKASLEEQLKEADFVAAALDCSAKSRAREIPRKFADGRPAPRPEGLPDLAGADLKRVKTDNQACSWVLSQLQAHAEHGGASVRENPWRSLHWWLRQEQEMLRSGLWSDCRYAACAWGGARCKSQCLRHNVDEICHHSHHPQEWQPTTVQGKRYFPSHEEAEYTAPLSFASILVGGRREHWLDFDPKALREWAMATARIAWASPWTPEMDCREDEWATLYIQRILQSDLSSDLASLQGITLACNCPWDQLCEADLLAGVEPEQVPQWSQEALVLAFRKLEVEVTCWSKGRSASGEVIRFRDTAVPEVKFGFPGVEEVQVILLKGQGDDMEPIFPKEELLDVDVKEAIGDEFIKAEKFEAKAGNVASFPFVSDIRVRMVLVGLGDKDVDSRFAGATAARALQALKGVQCAGVVAEGLEAASFVEGLLLGFHNDQRFQGTKTPEKDKVKGPAEVHLSFGSREDLQRGEAVATSVIFARELVNAPANFVNPPNLALAAEDLASRLGLEAKILDEKECEELGMGSFLAVSKCSDLGARLIHLTYKEGKGSRKVGIVGKGLTFDSGGYNIKCGAGCLIEMMKTDMAGSAATLGAAAALAQLKPKDVEVHFIIATTENMISGNPGSLHPGDIITAMDGTTIEVNNTDAEGRLTLADALLYCQQQGVTEVVDIATLTGAKMVGLGLEISALYSNSEDLAQRLETSAKATGEKLWRMPLEDGYFEQLKSDFADMKNAGTRWGGSITAALFLQKFIQKDDMNWAHLDIAGADYAEKVKGVNNVGGMIAKLKMKPGTQVVDGHRVGSHSPGCKLCGAQFTSKLEGAFDAFQGLPKAKSQMWHQDIFLLCAFGCAVDKVDLIGMLTDLSLALDTQKDFKEHCERLPEGKGALGGIDFNVTVLTTGFWPSYQVQEASLCPEMQKAIQVFSNYYNGKTQHRRLQWIHSLGQATIAAKLNGRRHDLIVNSYQALILLLFTRDEAHNLSFIQNSTGLEPGMCKKLLATLSIAKFKILSKTGDLKTIEDDASFAPNDSFQCQHRKIKIPPPVTEETHNKERVEEDRSIAIEAAIVRIMKMRKTLNHQQLVTEVLTQLAFFKPNPKLVKQRIEHLIEREYLERDKNQASVYRYLA
ncbi:unnamed protein product [Effrenium voratum]|nr:unnamed protein product [Effrenium voratum]